MTVSTQSPATGVASPATSVSLYWPWLVDARALFGSGALDDFYLYSSTDHESVHANSGIWLYTPHWVGTGAALTLAPTVGRGRVYLDNVSGNQTETPAVIRDVSGQYKAIMLYQQEAVTGAVGAQLTLWAWSNDGVTWARGGISIDINPWRPGDGHCGYARPLIVGNSVYTHSLRGGAEQPHFALWESNDGARTHSHLSSLGLGRDQLGDGRPIEWNSGNVVRWRGQLIWVGLASDFSAGNTAKDARIAVAPISEDLRFLVGRPSYELFPVVAPETTNYRALHAFVYDSELWVIYQAGFASPGTGGNLYLAKAV